MSKTTDKKTYEAELLAFLSEQVLRFRQPSVGIFLRMCFLCDWKHSLEYKRSLLSADWVVNNNALSHQPFESFLRSSRIVRINSQGRVSIGSSKPGLKFREGSSEWSACVEIISIISTRSDENISDICKSTYPFLCHGNLNLTALADEYRPMRNFIPDYLETA